MPRDVGVVVVAAGRGERMGGDVPKQFLPIGGVPMLLRTLRPFLAHPDLHTAIVVLAPELASSPPPWLGELAGGTLRLVSGGAARMDSVEAGLGALPSACQIVLVHDGARPFPSAGVIDAVIAEARHGRGAIAAVPLADTLKEAEDSTEARPPIRRTVPRAGLWRAQTPQGFPRALLERAMADARRNRVLGTDEASLVERLGGQVVLVPDSSLNLKVTTRDDLLLAEALAAER
ncbi:MAG: 2-C-methyl-D-erythritol 4-phosphate cytidylyltransferase [Gemmatimonadales bacterium]|nr:2-C-methyl-D-erythritol 4-phosphate cytidylyltransferase [Gemmatimonadales bacterium]